LVLFLLVCHAEAGLERISVEYKDDLVTVRGGEADVLSVLEEVSEWMGAQIFVFGRMTQRNLPAHFLDKPMDEVLKALLKGHSYAIIYSSDPNPATGVYVLGGVGRGTKRVKPVTRISRSPHITSQEDEDGLKTGLRGSTQQGKRSGQPSPGVMYQGGKTLSPDNDKASTKARIQSQRSSGQDPRWGRESHGSESPLRENGGDEMAETPWAVEEAEAYLLGEIENLEWQIAARESDNDYNPLVETLGLAPIKHDRALLEWYKDKFRKLDQK
jgi:hypothetical protein